MTSAEQPATSAAKTSPSSTPRSEGCSRSISIAFHSSRPSDAPPSSDPKQNSESTETPLRRQALFDLSRLLVGVHVQRQAFALGVTGQVLEPGTGTCPNGVGGDADPDAPLAQRLELTQVIGRVLLAEALDPAARVGREEQDKSDPGLIGSLGGRKSLLEPEVVELTDRRIAGAELLAIDVEVVLPDLSRCQA